MTARRGSQERWTNQNTERLEHRLFWIVLSATSELLAGASTDRSDRAVRRHSELSRREIQQFNRIRRQFATEPSQCNQAMHGIAGSNGTSVRCPPLGYFGRNRSITSASGSGARWRLLCPIPMPWLRDHRGLGTHDSIRRGRSPRAARSSVLTQVCARRARRKRSSR